MDISDTLAPKSDQLDAVDLLGGARVFTVKGVRGGSDEQPVQVDLEEFPRPWRPGKSMRRVLAACWGPIATEWIGRRCELYCEPNVIFGGEQVGGTRIKRLSHIDKRQSVPLIIKRGKSAVYTVDPLPDAPTPAPAQRFPTRDEVAACDDLHQLQAWSAASTGARKAAIEERIAALMDVPDAIEEPPMSADEEAGELA